MSKKQKKFYMALKSIEQLLILVSATTGCVSSFTSASLLGFPVVIESSAEGLNIWAITAEIKK